MAFTRVSTGWSLNGEVTSAELNQLDIDHANAVDKTGDTVPGALTFGARCYAQSGMDLEDVTNVTGGSELDFVSGASCNFASGTSCNFSSGASIVLYPSSSMSCATTITITGAGGRVLTVSGGRIVLGDNDYPQYASARSYTRMVPLAGISVPSAFSTGWSIGVSNLHTLASGVYISFSLGSLIPHGATLTSVELRFTPVGGHSNLPAGNISISLTKYTPAVGGAIGAGTVLASATYSPVSLGDYNNGNIKSLTISPGAVIDSASSFYSFTLADESGANAVAGNAYHALVMAYTLPELRPA
jgi:hypothetical protein